jgi:long-chain acyl-CoA synthetase
VGNKGVTVKEFSTPAVVQADPISNASQLLVDRVTSDPDGALFSLPRADGGWEDVTTAEFHAQVSALAKGFMAAGVNAGDKIGFISTTTYEWTLVDFGLWFAGAIMVPIYETSSPSQIHYTLEDSEAVGIIVETAEHFQRFDEIASETPRVVHIWNMHLGDLAKLASRGGTITDAALEERRTTAQGSDMATLIYTSGSTGQPKGCVLTHSNFVELVRNSAVAMKEVVEPGAATLLFITTAHIYARFISLLAVHTGTKIGHQADTTQLLPSLASFRPTFLLAVPRVFEKVYNSAEQKAEAGGKGAIFRAAADTAVEYSKALDSDSVSLWLRLRFTLFDRLVYSKLRAAMGGNVVYAVSGSAPLSTRLGHFYRTLGITILEGYGLTETTAPSTENLVTKFKIGTCGPALPGVSVRTAEDGEVQIKGVNVFDGYWKNDAATKEAFTKDGWFRTGDIGELDEEGYLTVTGRKKEIIITAGGKNVAPNYLEDPIRSNPIVSQVVVVGDQRPFIGALITLDPDMIDTWLANNGVGEKLTLDQARIHPVVLAEVQRAIDGANTRVSRAESVRKFTILDVDFTEKSGHLTPKMSIKRADILRDFHADVEALYSSSPETQGLSLSS